MLFRYKFQKAFVHSNVQKEEIAVESCAKKYKYPHVEKQTPLKEQIEVATYPEELIEDARAECGPISKDTFASTVFLLAEDRGAAGPVWVTEAVYRMPNQRKQTAGF